jgi:DNA-binding MarR family transcriptional regulator
MSKRPVPFETTIHVRDTCLCLHVQRAARLIARRFDVALQPFGLTNQQFSLLMSLNRPAPAKIGELSRLLGMDRTSLTAAAKALEARGLISIAIDADDRRARRLILTDAGQSLLATALPTWHAEHGALEAALTDATRDRLRVDLNHLARAA